MESLHGHLVGEYDQVVPPGIWQSYRHKLGRAAYLEMLTVAATHREGWLEPWNRLLASPMNCKSKNGGIERTRTSDLGFRKPLLYPAELRPLEG